MAVVLQYPEFFMAGLLGILLIISPSKAIFNFHLPEWLTEPAKIVVFALPAKYVGWLIKMLNWAGFRQMSILQNLCFAKVSLGVISVLGIAVMPLWAMPLIVVGLFFLPDLVLMLMVNRRKKQILQSLPQALDLMVLCVDAGLGLDATLKRIAGESNVVATALNDELLSLGRDILFGMERERAYQELFNRTGVDELKTLGSALNQSGRLGLSISRILRAQSEFMRMKQSQKAEERAFKLPIYMAFPLWFCIMPALMLIVLGPSLIMFFQQVQSGLLR